MPDLNIEPEDLDQEPLPPPPSPAASEDDLLVIESDDLANVATTPPSPATRGGQGGEALFPPLPKGAEAGGEALSGKGGTLAFSHVAGWSLLHLALAGALGGFLAWACNEPFTNDQAQETEPLVILLHMALFGASLGGLIGATLGAVEGLSAGVIDKALRGAGLGLLIGGAGGALGGLLGQLLYGGLHGGKLPLLAQILVRAFAWALVGVFVGLGQGAQGASPRKLANGLLGGAIGGFAGGFLFDPIGSLVQFFVSGEGPHAGWLSRMVAMVVMGICTGAAIALVQELRKEAWLIVVGGPLSGKQFILHRPLTSVGSSPKSDICLLRDPGILPQHFFLQQPGPAHLLVATPDAPVALNGRPTARHHLHNGDMIGLGHTVLEYRLKAVPPGLPED